MPQRSRPPGRGRAPLPIEQRSGERSSARCAPAGLDGEICRGTPLGAMLDGEIFAGTPLGEALDGEIFAGTPHLDTPDDAFFASTPPLEALAGAIFVGTPLGETLDGLVFEPTSVVRGASRAAAPSTCVARQTMPDEPAGHRRDPADHAPASVGHPYPALCHGRCAAQPSKRYRRRSP